MKRLGKSDDLYHVLRRQVAGMADGTVFPTIRALMAGHGVSQSTVVTTVNRLKDLGWLAPQVGQGTVVRKPEADGKPRFVLLQSDWDDPSLLVMQGRIRTAAEEAGFRYAHHYWPHREDVTRQLGAYEADAIVIDSITDDRLTPPQIMAIFRAPAPVILYRNAVALKEINLPALQKARDSARLTVCVNNHKQQFAGFALYANDFEWYPAGDPAKQATSGAGLNLKSFPDFPTGSSICRLLSSFREYSTWSPARSKRDQHKPPRILVNHTPG